MKDKVIPNLESLSKQAVQEKQLSAELMASRQGRLQKK